MKCSPGPEGHHKSSESRSPSTSPGAVARSSLSPPPVSTLSFAQPSTEDSVKEGTTSDDTSIRKITVIPEMSTESAKSRSSSTEAASHSEESPSYESTQNVPSTSESTIKTLASVGELSTKNILTPNRRRSASTASTTTSASVDSETDFDTPSKGVVSKDSLSESSKSRPQPSTSAGIRKAKHTPQGRQVRLITRVGKRKNKPRVVTVMPLDDDEDQTTSSFSDSTPQVSDSESLTHPKKVSFSLLFHLSLQQSSREVKDGLLIICRGF